MTLDCETPPSGEAALGGVGESTAQGGRDHDTATSFQTEILDAALRYAAAGLPVFPCRNARGLPGHKAPLTPNGYKDATTDPATIRAWWTKNPSALIGLPTGAITGIAVLDIDVKNGKDGFAAVPGWEGMTPLRSRTASGGAHLFFRADQPIRCTTGRDGVDVRGEGGYVIVPPSEGYSWAGEALGMIDLSALPPFPAAYLRSYSAPDPSDEGLLAEEPELVGAALRAIPNAEEDWEEWNRIGLAVWAATGGDDDGFDAWDEWSQKSTKYSIYETRARWDHFRRSPPSLIGFGTLFYMASEADPAWLDKFEREREAAARASFEEADAAFRDLVGAAKSAVNGRAATNGAGEAASRGAGSNAADARDGAKAQPEGGEAVPFALTDAADWDGLQPPRQEWLVALHILPATVNGLYGEGAVGKSLAAQQLCTSLAAGVSFLGLTVAQCNTAYLTAEDDIGELQRRQGDICAALGIKFADLRGKLHLGSLIDERDKALMRHAGRHNDRLLPTFALRRLRATISALNLRCVALDNIGHFFGGNEIARDDVVAFLGELNALARELNCAIVLIGHPNKSGAAYSGSTAWQNQVRMQLVLSRPDRDGDPNMRELRREKANYGPPGEGVRVLWHHGAFVLEDQVPADDAQRVNAAMIRQSEIFFACLETLNAQERGASAAKNAGNYAPKLFATLPGTIKKGMKPEDFERVMNHLLAAGTLETGPLPWRTASRNAALGLRRKDSAGGANDTPM